jgi:hypothetical protein
MDGCIVFGFNAGTHISQILKAPENFGLTRETFAAEYDCAGEGIPYDEITAQKVILKVLQKGAINVRYLKSEKILSIDVGIWNDFVKENLYEWLIQSESDGILTDEVAAWVKGKTLTDKVKIMVQQYQSGNSNGLRSEFDFDSFLSLLLDRLQTDSPRLVKMISFDSVEDLPALDINEGNIFSAESNSHVTWQKRPEIIEVHSVDDFPKTV